MHIVRSIDETGNARKGSTIEVSPYVPCNWYSERGAQKKLSLLKKKGLPSFKDWRFLTLTVDGEKFKSAQSAYEYIKPRMRYFIREVKKYLKIDQLDYMWKLEFQENGMPHWHMLINYKKPICVSTLFQLWGFGYVDIERCKTKGLPYILKYISKSNEGLPSWFKQYSRPRVFQSSGIFPSSSDVENGDSGEVNKPKSPPESLGSRLERYKNTVTLSKNGRTFKTVNVKVNWAFSFLFLISFSFAEFIHPEQISIPQQHIGKLII